MLALVKMMVATVRRARQWLPASVKVAMAKLVDARVGSSRTTRTLELSAVANLSLCVLRRIDYGAEGGNSGYQQYSTRGGKEQYGAPRAQVGWEPKGGVVGARHPGANLLFSDCSKTMPASRLVRVLTLRALTCLPRKVRDRARKGGRNMCFLRCVHLFRWCQLEPVDFVTDL